MKKLFGIVGIAFAGLFALSSCKSSKDLQTLRKDTISDAIKAEYNIEFDDTNGKVLYNKERSAKTTSYYDVYIANNDDYKSNLVTYSINLSELIKKTPELEKRLSQKKLSGIPVYAPMFSASAYSDELSAFIKELYNSSYGILSTTKNEDKSLTKNYDFGIEVDKAASWTRTLEGKYLNLAYLETNSDITINITYLPVYLYRMYKGETIVKLYAFLPVREAALLNGKKIVAPKDKASKYSLEDYEIVGKEVNFNFDPETNLLVKE